MIISQIGYCFKLNNNLFIAKEIGLESLSQLMISILQNEFALGLKRDFLMYEFQLYTFLINSFKKSTSHFFVNVEACSNNRIAFFRINNF